MKKIIIILLACVVLLGFVVLIAVVNLPALASYTLSRSMGFVVTVEKAGISFSDGTINVSLGNIRLKGPISGRFGQVAAKVFFYRGIFLQRLTIKDFDLTVNNVELKGGDLSVPVEMLEINKGSVTIQKRKLFIESVIAENINTLKPLIFMASIKDPDHDGKVRVAGSSVIEKKKHLVKGSVDVDSFGLEKIDSALKGTVTGKGDFTFYDGALTLKGDCMSPKLTLTDTWLKKPLVVENVKATSTILTRGGDVEITVNDAEYHGVPFKIVVEMKNYVFSQLTVTSGFVPMSDVRENVTTEGIGYDVWEYVKDGSLRIRKITYKPNNPFRADLELKNITAIYENKHLTGIEGLLAIEENKGVFSESKGYFKASTFYDMKGTIEFGKQARIRAQGKYSLDLTHVPEFVEMKDIMVHKGAAEGTVEIDSVKGKDISLGGSGRINNAELSWRQHPFHLSGPFRLSGGEIAFNPVVLTGKEMNITLNGKWGPKGLGTTVKGYVDAGFIGDMTGRPVKASGRILLDGQAGYNDGQFRGSGAINMNDLAYDIPGFIRKAKNVHSGAQIKVTGKKTGDIVIEEFTGNLAVMNIKAQGTITPDKKIGGHIVVEAHDMGRAASLFYLDEDIKGGDLYADVRITDLSLPLTKLPFTVGTVKIKNGFFKVPGMAKALSNIDLTSDFRGKDFDVTINGLTCGKSVLKKAVLSVKGLESPRFNVVANMDRLDISDFRNGSEFRIGSMKKEGFLARTSGNMSLRVKELKTGKVQGNDLEINAFMTDRKINISELKLRMFDGEIDAKGMADLSGEMPYLYINGKMMRVKAGVFFQALGSTSQEISGTAHLNGAIKTEGTTGKELIGNMNGDVSVYSRNGVIKRWKLLSKIFALLNVYDLVRGKIDFGQDGLAYNKMGSSFTVKKGVFHANNFLLDSPSMVITGAGNLDVNNKTIDGTLEVSPLVALDRTIDKIPVVRSILKNKNKGFLYVVYKVSGSFDDPDISTNYVGTVGTKSLEILKNILVFPREVFEK